jgi:hypothetical protein
MKNSKNLEKSRGVVVFAFNTDVDYVTIADRTSRLINHSLGLPVTLITDADSDPKFDYDQVIRVNPQGNTTRTDLNDFVVTWKNFGRYLAYELSPYEETVLVDTDYVVLDDSLNTLFSIPFDYRLMHHNTNPDNTDYGTMGETSLPFVWATVILFRKSPRAQMLFSLVGRIQRNYNYYRALYNIQARNYRNDYAFAIANNILNGYNLNIDQSIPWSMFTVDKKIKQIQLTNTQVRIYHEDTAVVTPYQNIHVMDKEYLLSRDFEQVVGAICEPT